MSSRLPIAAYILILLTLGGCSTGFGEPCTIPQTPQFRQACNTISDDSDGTGSAIEMESRASCALENFAGCETRVCLVYRGSDPFCSLRCQNDGACEGGAVCAPLLGNVERSCCDPSVRNDPAMREQCSGFLEGVACYCIRQSDIPALPAAPTCRINNDCITGEQCCNGQCVGSEAPCDQNMSME